MFGAFHVRRIVPFVLAAVFTLLLLPALLIAAQEPTPTATPPQPPGTPLPWVTEPAVTGARLASTPIPASPFELLFTDSFDDENYTANFWTFGVGWEQSSSGGRGQVLQVTGSDASVTFVHDTILDAAIQARFLVSAGAVRFNLRQSATGAYTVTLTADGIVMLTRGADLLGMAVSTVAPNTWHTIRLSALGGDVEVEVDGASVIIAQDSVPLPAGTVSISSANATSGASADDFSLWILSEHSAEEPELGLAIIDDIEAESFVTQSLGTGWQREPTVFEPGFSLAARTTTTAISMADEAYFNVAAQIDLRLYNSTARLSVRASEAGAYTAHVTHLGEVRLYRGTELLGTATANTEDYGPWRVLRLVALEDVIQVEMDGVLLIEVSDGEPLPEGSVQLAAEIADSGTTAGGQCGDLGSLSQNLQLAVSH